MKISFSKGKKLIAIALVSALLLTALPMTLSASADTVVTEVNTAPNTNVFTTSYFTDKDLASSFTKWSSGGATISDGVLTLTGISNNTRDNAYFYNTPSLNQTASMTFETNEASTTCKGSAVLWIRGGSYYRSQYKDNVPTGYYLSAYIASSTCTVTLNKAYVKDEGTDSEAYGIAALGKLDGFAYVDSGVYSAITIEATANYDTAINGTVISIRILKNGTTMYAATIEDFESELQDAGKVGFAYQKGETNSSINITGYSYHTTDNEVNKSVIGQSYFTADNLTENMGYIVSNNKVTAAEGAINITPAPSNYRDASIFTTSQYLNGTVRAVVKTPHTIANNALGTAYQQNVAVWLRATTTKRENGATVPIGYFAVVSFTAAGYAEIKLYKQGLNDNKTDITGHKEISTSKVSMAPLAHDGSKMWNVELVADVKTENGATTITLTVYKSTNVAGTLTATDSEEVLQVEGKAGVAASSIPGVTATDSKITALYVNAESPVDNAFLQENTAKTTGAMVAQLVALEKGATYQFSAKVDKDFTNEPLTVMYKTGNYAGNRLTFTPTTEGVVVDAKYKKYTYTFTVGDDAVVSNNGWVYAFAGYAQSNSTVNSIRYTDFELRKVTDGAVGGNLMVNGDFKMGAYAWNSQISESGGTSITSWNLAFNGLDDISVYSNRFKYYRDSNKFNYWNNFVADDYTAGDVNSAEGVDICDLVYLTNMSTYDIYADMNCDGDITVDDETLLRTTVLNGVVDLGN